MSYDPFRYDEATGLKDITIYASAQNQWIVQVEGGGLAFDALAVGSGGAVIRWTREGSVAGVARFPRGADLYAVATEELDWFVVGSGGTIFHGVTEHAEIAPTVLL